MNNRLPRAPLTRLTPHAAHLRLAGRQLGLPLTLSLFLALLIVLSTIPGCHQQEVQKQLQKEVALKKAIANLNGVYTRHSKAGPWNYSASVELEKILSQNPPEYTARVLIECLDDTSESASILAGKPVSLGIVCYQGLSQLVYYEPIDDRGDTAASWPGLITPEASQEELRNAKAAWKKAQEVKLLIFQ